ncbi:inactive serine/threonine-protein kinase 19 isoform X4 [Taeniopygia guttata]|uniref:inactive serine/threonine-protein kinase 19 isoform X4 n=1 Tax=Taeniopygia guttata TaxID=59729 RepID=UPI003BB874CF
MSRRRRRLEDPRAAIEAKRRRPGLPAEPPRPDGSPAAVEAALGAVAALFPRRLFGDALPPLLLRHQLYSLVPDRTAVDRHLALAAVAGSPREPLVRRFLEVAVMARPELSYGERQLVAVGLLTVRDVGSWWVAVPGVGRFVRALLRGRRALLSLFRRARLRQLPQGALGGGKTPPGAALGVPFLLHDLLGEGRLQSIPTPAGPLLRLAEP